MAVTATPRDALLRDGTAQLFRFRRARRAEPEGLPVLLVPSLINRWYVLDLRPGSSAVEALVGAGLDVFCVDWGAPEDEDRYLGWDDVLDRLSRMARAVRRVTEHRRLGLLGYCMGGTVASIWTALNPDRVAALVNLAGPIDFSKAGRLAHMTDPRWFDPEAVAAAGNVHPAQMQAGFVALRPTAQIAKWMSLFDRLDDREAMEAFRALDDWAGDNIAFPARAYVRYIRELYQNNQLARGEHAIRGRRVDLRSIRCPVLTVVMTRDVICPPPAATALNELSGSTETEVLEIPGGHVGAVVGSRASELLYPKLVEWLGGAR